MGSLVDIFGALFLFCVAYFFMRMMTFRPKTSLNVSIYLVGAVALVRVVQIALS